MGLFNAAQVDKINAAAAKSNEVLKPPKAINAKSINDDLNEMSNNVIKYFSDSESILITSKDQLHEYIDSAIEVGYVGYDTETTGLDRIKDTIVGCSFYYPGGVDCYIPCKHKIPIFEEPYKNQLTYEEVGEELQRLVNSGTKMILANADFDIAMTYKDFNCDIIPVVYFDVILAWRCIKENEKDNSLKGLYAKYVKHGEVDPMKFSDFFSPTLFPYCKPEVAKLYAANDAKITYELFKWQLPYVTKGSKKCEKHHLDKIADLVWNIEMPMIAVCAKLHRVGVELDQTVASPLHNLFTEKRIVDEKELAQLVQQIIDDKDVATNRKRPFKTGSDFNPSSPVHVKYLINNLLGKDSTSTGKDVLKDINMPVTDSILKVRGDVKLLSTYVDKLPGITAPWDGRIHCSFKSVGADTGRMSSADPNLQNIPSKLHNIRHLFRASSEEIEEVKVLDNLSVTVSNIDYVEILGKGWIHPEDVAEHDKLELIDGSAKGTFEVIQTICDLVSNDYTIRLKEC